jgi:hypothetical protein
MAYSRKEGVWSTAKDKLAIASLVLAVIAMFGVIPLSIFPFIISCEIVDWTVCTDIDNAVRFFYYLCLSSIAASILAIILGLISYPGAEKDSTTRVIAAVGMGIGFIVWPLVLITGFLLWLGSMG